MPDWDMRGRIVLVIDDKRDVLQATAVLLERWGCEVRMAESGEQAQALLRRDGLVPAQS